MSHAVSVAPDLSWAYDFWASVRDYVFVREEDNVVILPPNMVYKTNETGVKVLRFLDSGRRFDKSAGFDDEKLGDIGRFLTEIRDICDGRDVPTERIAYGFDFTRLPILGEIAVTYRCNNRCQFCYAGCGGGNACGAGGKNFSSAGGGVGQSYPVDGASREASGSRAEGRSSTYSGKKRKYPSFPLLEGNHSCAMISRSLSPMRSEKNSA